MNMNMNISQMRLPMSSSKSIMSMNINPSSTTTRSSQIALRQATNSTNSTNSVIDAPKKMTWGEPTWLLFHTLAHKVNDTMFPQVRAELLNTIYSICANLPCPDCAEHAKTYLSKINFSSAIKTKNDLKLALFIFHNEVNKRKGAPIFHYSELDSKYSNAVTINIIYNFMNSFEKKSKSIRMIANDTYRARVADSLKTWFNQNIKYFEA